MLETYFAGDGRKPISKVYHLERNGIRLDLNQNQDISSYKGYFCHSFAVDNETDCCCTSQRRQSCSRTIGVFTRPISQNFLLPNCTLPTGKIIERKSKNQGILCEFFGQEELEFVFWTFTRNRIARTLIRRNDVLLIYVKSKFNVMYSELCFQSS